MDALSDSDDSAFLFSANVPKRKAESNVGKKVKKVKLNLQRDSTKDDMQRNGEIRTGKCDSDSVHVHKILESVAEVSTSNESPVENDAVEKLLPQKVDTQFSCPLCLKILHSESIYFFHMKQCAKKSKMSAKQLLEALQLHKQHLKERLSAGSSNILAKKKKINVQETAEDSTYQLALGLALSKSLKDIDAGKENENIVDDVNSHTRNTTLEKFGFTSFGKPVSGVGKKSKNSKPVNSILKTRTNEDREKILTEKAGIILLINDATMVAEPQESVRVYHCKHLEETRNKASYLWKLGEDIEEPQWYVENLKSIMLQENTEPEDSQNLTYEECNIDEEIKKLNLPKATIFEDWKRLINSKHLSDLMLHTKDDETVYLHSVVLYARCPTILETDLKTIIHKFEKWIILKFLQYLYCGTLDGLIGEEIEYLFDLAQSLGYQELLDVLNCLKNSLSRKTHSGIDRDIPEIDSGCEWGHTSHSRSVLCNGNRRETDDEINDVDELYHDREEQKSMDVSNRTEPCENLQMSPDGETCNTEENHSEMDMFEEAENLNRSLNKNDGIPENDRECIDISSGSVKSDVIQTETSENEKILSDMDYEIPYFDPYEHFNSDIPDAEPFAGSEIQSQSLIVGENSPVKSATPKTSFIDNVSSCAMVSECCSIPNEISQPSTSAQANLTSSKRPVKKRRYATPCSKINRKSGRLFGSKSWMKGNLVEGKSKTFPEEEDSEKVACVLTESILKEFDYSIEATPKEELNYIEVTPTVPNEEFIEDVSPLPDYSVMGASSIKKHLTKYGLKKSLSKNKAKKILRHIYEELHPILNMKNGKIVKYIQSVKQKKRRERKVEKKNTGKNTLTQKIAEKSRKEMERIQPETPTKKSCSSLKTAMEEEEDRQSCTSSDGESARNSLSDGSCFEVEEPSSQSNYTNASDAPATIYDFIHNNPDIHRQILLYEPIWLEDLQRKLFEKYNKKFKLTDLMDCLDAECVTFRCESQKRTNNRRK